MISIQPAGVQDAFLAAQLAALLQEEEGYPVLPETALALQAEMIRDLLDGTGALFLAVHGTDEGTHTAVGMVELKRTRDASLGTRYEIRRLFVLPEFRGGKVGRLLLEAAAAAPPEEEALIVMTTTGPLRRSYAKLGFSPIAQINAARLSDVRKAMRMEDT